MKRERHASNKARIEMHTIGLSELEARMRTLYVMRAPESSIPKLINCITIWPIGEEWIRCQRAHTYNGKWSRNLPQMIAANE
jgi:hypothetical protein